MIIDAMITSSVDADRLVVDQTVHADVVDETCVPSETPLANTAQAEHRPPFR